MVGVPVFFTTYYATEPLQYMVYAMDIQDGQVQHVQNYQMLINKTNSKFLVILDVKIVY